MKKKASRACRKQKPIVGTHKFRSEILAMTVWGNYLIVATKCGVYRSQDGRRFYRCSFVDSSSSNAELTGDALARRPG
jgi:hypothetical protein